MGSGRLLDLLVLFSGDGLRERSVQSRGCPVLWASLFDRQADAEALRSDLQELADDPDYPDALGQVGLAVWADAVLELLAVDDPWWKEPR
jgi:hypothetical protein